jgi:hypothetical protein
LPHADTATFAARIARVAGAFRAHPVAVTVSVLALALGVASIVAGWNVSAPSQAAVPPPPLPRRGQFAGGPLSLEAADSPGRFVAVDGNAAALVAADATSRAEARRAATFLAMPGLADAGCLSFRTVDGRFLRDVSGVLAVSDTSPDAAFRREATFCPRSGFARGSVTLEALGRRGKLIRHVGAEMRVEQGDDRGSVFMVRAPLS